MKILHFSDLHLDVGFSESHLPPKVARECRMRLRQTFLRMIDLAIERQADVVTIGGDLFEHDRVSKDTINFVMENLQHLAPKPVLIAPGNHDYYSPASPYARLKWPGNVFIFRDSAIKPFFVNSDFAVWGMAHCSPSERKNPLEAFTRTEAAKTNILLMHGSEVGNFVENRAAHAPFRLDDIENAGFTFALLGHYHGMRMLDEDEPLAAYPGSPQPLSFGEDGRHGAIFLNIVDQFVECEFIPTATQAFLTVSLSPSSEATDAHTLAEETLLAAGRRAQDANFLRLQLSGIQQSDAHLDKEYLKEYLLQYFEHVVIVDRMRSQIDVDIISQEQTVRGAFTRELQRVLMDADEDQEIVRMALKYGLDAFEEGKLLKQ